MTGQGNGGDPTGSGAIINGLLISPGAVKMLIPMTIGAGMEIATEGEALMKDFFPWASGFSSGGIVAVIIAHGMPLLRARDFVIPVLHAELGNDPNAVAVANIGHDIAKFLNKTANRAGGKSDKASLRAKFLTAALKASAKAVYAGSHHFAASRIPQATPDSVQHHYDHNILVDALRPHFDRMHFSDLKMPVFVFSHDRTTGGAVIFAALTEDAENANGGLQYVHPGETPNPYRLPVYDPEIIDGLASSTLIRGMMVRRANQATGHDLEDAADHAMPLMHNIIDYIVTQASRRLQKARTEKPAPRKDFLSWIGSAFAQRASEENITPTIVPRLIQLGVGIMPSNDPQHSDAGFGAEIFGYPDISANIARHSFFAQFHARFDHLSQVFAKRDSIIRIDAPITPAENDPDAALYPSDDLRRGDADNQQRLIWFAVNKVFKSHAQTLADEMILALQARHDQGDVKWTDEKLARTISKIRKNMCTEEGLNALCGKLVMSDAEIGALIDTHRAETPAPASQAAPMPEILPVPAMPRQALG